ncbi:MAG: hypothetical protein J6S14_21970 [Clostridia bacterium]|nr:hypothetical protein [Clostridia bacterium]
MAKEISTAGIQVYYATESTAGTRPTSGYTNLAHVKEIPEFDPGANGLQVTDLSDLVWHRYIPGLKDAGDDFAFTINAVEETITAWDALVATAKTAYEAGKRTWFAFVVPNWTKAFYIAGLPQSAGFAGASVDEVFDGTLHITPCDVAGWQAAPTLSA